MTTTFDGIEMTTGAGETELSIIWLHGLGADGNDFAPVVPELEKLGVTNCRYIFPHAPLQPVTINGGMTMRSWYDITSLDFDSRGQDAAGIQTSARRVEQLIQREVERGMRTEQIMLAGFSQGGAVVLHTMLRLPHKIAGVIALSTYLPLADTVADTRHDANQDTPIFMAHGQHDEVIELRFAKDSHDVLLQQGYQVQWQTYAMPHSLAMEELADLAKWINDTRPEA